MGDDERIETAREAHERGEMGEWLESLSDEEYEKVARALKEQEIIILGLLPRGLREKLMVVAEKWRLGHLLVAAGSAVVIGSPLVAHWGFGMSWRESVLVPAWFLGVGLTYLVEFEAREQWAARWWLGLVLHALALAMVFLLFIVAYAI